MVWYGYSGFGYGSSSFANNFLTVQLPLYLLIFSVLVIILAKLLNSALAAVPIAIIVTAATGSFLLLFVRRMSLFFMNDLAVLVGFVIAAVVVLKMFMKV